MPGRKPEPRKKYSNTLESKTTIHKLGLAGRGGEGPRMRKELKFVLPHFGKEHDYVFSIFDNAEKVGGRIYNVPKEYKKDIFTLLNFRSSDILTVLRVDKEDSIRFEPELGMSEGDFILRITGETGKNPIFLHLTEKNHPALFDKIRHLYSGFLTH